MKLTIKRSLVNFGSAIFTILTKENAKHDGTIGHVAHQEFLAINNDTRLTRDEQEEKIKSLFLKLGSEIHFVD